MDGLGVLALGVLVLCLTPVVAIDLKSRRIPNACNLVLGAAGLGYVALREPSPIGVGGAAAQAAITAGLLHLALWVCARLKRDVRIGGGDIKFLIAASLWVGLEGAVVVLILSSLLMLAVSGTRRLAAPSGWTEERPFGPMLAAALFAVAVVFELGR